jgi:hypothetical protein
MPKGRRDSHQIITKIINEDINEDHHEDPFASDKRSSSQFKVHHGGKQRVIESCRLPPDHYVDKYSTLTHPCSLSGPRLGLDFF